jgi:hypothetical protein
MAIKIGLEDFANEIPHLAREFFYYRLPRKTVRKVAIQLASHDLQGSGLMGLTLEERESRRFPHLNDEIQEEMKEEEGEEDGPLHPVIYFRGSGPFKYHVGHPTISGHVDGMNTTTPHSAFRKALVMGRLLL